MRVVNGSAVPLFGCIMAAVSLGGCSTYQVSKYSLSVANTQAYKTPGVIKVNVASFTAEGDAANTEMSCRLVGPIRTPSGETFAGYVQSAMTDELRVAGLYDEAAPVVIKGHLAHLAFASAGEGTWELTLVVTIGSQAPFTVERKYKFETSFIGEKACALGAQAFLPAVQDLLGAVANDPAFRKAMTSGSAQATNI